MSTSSGLHRAIVTYTDAVTGEIRVVSPTLGGADKEITISLFGRTPALQQDASYKYAVPQVGQQVVVAADDQFLTNVFIIKTWG